MNETGSTDQSDLHGVELTAPRSGAKRKLLLFRQGILGLGGALALALLAGCSTAGPGHVYLYTPALGETIRDIDPQTGAERGALLSRVAKGERVLGVAYDPYTDHIFIRLFPGNRILVIDRPANAIKRGFLAPNLPLGGHDLAIRSRDRHLFYTDPTAPALFETDLNGELENYLPLEGITAPPWGVAYDNLKNELLVLPTETSSMVKRFTPAGKALGEVELEVPVQGISLGFDADARNYYASLADGSAIGVFDERGRLVRSLDRPSPDRETFIDIGPRSLLRLF